MNHCVLEVEVSEAPTIRYTQDNQTPVAEMTVRFDGLRQDVLERIFEERKAIINQEKRAKKPLLSQVCVILDDLSGAAELQRRDDTLRRAAGGRGRGRRWCAGVAQREHAQDWCCCAGTPSSG